MKKILVTGGNGQLGSELKELSNDYSQFEFIFTDVEELDITNEEAVDQAFAESSPDFVLNCAAYTAVDKAESDLDLATKINATAPKLLAEASKRYGAKLIQISTDYVFDGTSHIPYTEEVSTSPNSAYGDTKLDGEKYVESIAEDYLIIRTSWLYSSFGNNFVKTMIRLGNERDELGIIFDQIGTPTYAADLAQTIMEAVAKIDSGDVVDYRGVYHFSNEGVCSWYDFAKEIFRLENIEVRVKPIETVDYPTPANRPHYSVMNKKKIKQTFGVRIPHWVDSLKICLKKLRD